jgi:hypothetical protein
MKPARFKQMNAIYSKPDSMTDQECESLPAWRDDRFCVSKWKMSLWEKIKLLFGASLWVYIWQPNGPPPIGFQVDRTIFSKAKKITETETEISFKEEEE